MTNPFLEKYIAASQRVDDHREKCAVSTRRLQDFILTGACAICINTELQALNNHINNLTVAEIARGVAARNLERAGVLGRVLAERRVS